MNGRKLKALVLLATAFSLGHTIDHIIRDDLRWAVTPESVGFLVVTIVTYGVIAAGLYLSQRERWGRASGRFSLALPPPLVGSAILARSRISLQAIFSALTSPRSPDGWRSPTLSH